MMGRKSELAELAWRLEGFDNFPGFDVVEACRQKEGEGLSWELTVQPLDGGKYPKLSWIVRTLEGYVPFDTCYRIVYAECIAGGGWKLRLLKEERKEDGQE